MTDAGSTQTSGQGGAPASLEEWASGSHCCVVTIKATAGHDAVKSILDDLRTSNDRKEQGVEGKLIQRMERLAIDRHMPTDHFGMETKVRVDQTDYQTWALKVKGKLNARIYGFFIRIRERLSFVLIHANRHKAGQKLRAQDKSTLETRVAEAIRSLDSL